MITPDRLSYHDYVVGLQTLSLAEQVRLVEMILANLTLRLPSLTRPSSKLAKLKPRHLICGNPEELVDVTSWEWNEQQNL